MVLAVPNWYPCARVPIWYTGAHATHGLHGARKKRAPHVAPCFAGVRAKTARKGRRKKRADFPRASAALRCRSLSARRGGNSPLDPPERINFGKAAALDSSRRSNGDRRRTAEDKTFCRTSSVLPFCRLGQGPRRVPLSLSLNSPPPPPLPAGEGERPQTPAVFFSQTCRSLQTIASSFTFKAN